MIMETMEVKYKYGNSSDFYRVLKSRVEDYFRQHNYSVYANTEMVAKITLTLLVYLGSYFLILSNRLPIPVMGLLAVLMGVSLAGIFLNISHDASHFALSRKTKVNRLLWYSMEFIGLNSYIWNYLHNAVHHMYTSIEGEDIIVEEYSLLRLSKNQPYRKVHRYQCFYAPFIYSLFSLILIFAMDFTLFARKKMGKIRPVSHSGREYLKLWLAKLFYLSYSLIFPLLILDARWWQVLLGYYLMHASAGIILSLVGVLNHQIDESAFPEPDAQGYIHNNKKSHEIEVTIDFSPDSAVASWLFGGFNTHVAHHLFPHICHVHYRALTKIIDQTAKQYGVAYKKLSISQAISSHFRFLKRLSVNTAPESRFPATQQPTSPGLLPR
jgi:linoleoyl-CoA desaturase